MFWLNIKLLILFKLLKYIFSTYKKKVILKILIVSTLESSVGLPLLRLLLTIRNPLLFNSFKKFLNSKVTPLYILFKELKDLNLAGRALYAALTRFFSLARIKQHLLKI